MYNQHMPRVPEMKWSGLVFDDGASVFALKQSQSRLLIWNVLYENGSCGFHFIT